MTRAFTPLRSRDISMLVALLVVATSPVAAQGDSSQAPIVITAAPSHSDIERAMRLEKQAEQDARFTRNWRDAATLRLRAARLRGPTSEAIDGYRRAAWFYSGSGDHGAGRRALEQGARVALERGEPARAVEMLLDATLLAHADGDPHQTNRLLDRSRSLLESAILPEDRRLALRARVDSAARLATR
jgi:hypothetical protein